MSMISDDPRIDPRIKAVFGPLPTFPMPSFESREELVAAMNTPEALARVGRDVALLGRGSRGGRALGWIDDQHRGRSFPSPTATRSRFA